MCVILKFEQFAIVITILVGLVFYCRAEVVINIVRLVDFTVNKVDVLVQVSLLVEFHVTSIKMACVWLLFGMDAQM